jgi:hypothetical protein
MKFNINKRVVQTALAVGSLTLLSGCGSSNNAPPPPAAAIGGIGGGCVPITTTNMIGFTATNMYLGNPATGDPRVLAGIIPPPGDENASGTYGTMMVNPGNVMPPVQTQFGAPVTFQSQRVDGTSITLSVTQAMAPGAPGSYPGSGYPYNSYPYSVSGQVNATGYIQLSSFLQQLLIQTATGNYGGSNGIISPMPGSYPGGYPNTYPQANLQQICVSNLAFSLQRTNASYANWLYLGYVYFYLSGGAYGAANGMHGLQVYF